MKKHKFSILPQFNKIYENQNYYYLTFVYFHGDSLLRIVQKSYLKEVSIATLIYHILRGLRQLHNNNYYHGNVKLENIIFYSGKKENEIYLINPKFSIVNDQKERDKLIKNGKNFYLAPEVLENQSYTDKSDMFSIGCCIFYIVFGVLPYKNICEDYIKNDPSYESRFSACGVDFLLNMLQIDPNLRMTAEQALHHSWFINYSNSQTSPRARKKIFRNQLKLIKSQHGISNSLRTIIESSEENQTHTIAFSKQFLKDLQTIKGQKNQQDVNVDQQSSFYQSMYHPQNLQQNNWDLTTIQQNIDNSIFDAQATIEDQCNIFLSTDYTESDDNSVDSKGHCLNKLTQNKRLKQNIGKMQSFLNIDEFDLTIMVNTVDEFKRSGNSLYQNNNDEKCIDEVEYKSEDSDEEENFISKQK